jgi:putative RecB family exonuclease
MAVCFDGNSMKISYTQVTTYQRCPHKYQLAYVDRIPVPKTPNLHLGNVVHGALSFMHKPGNLALPAQEAVIAEFCRLWQAEQAEIPEDQRDQYFQQGVEMLQRHYAREQSHTDRRQTATVEQYFSIPFAQDDNIAGRIDRVDVLDNGVLEVLDYKTGRRMPAQTDVNADLQLAIYRLAAQELLYPGKTVVTSFYYLLHGLTFTAEHTPRQLEEMKAEITDIIGNIEKGEFSPRVDRSCDWCDYRSHCLVFKPAVVSDAERADIDALIKDLADLETLRKANKAEAKEQDKRYAELAGAILDWLNNAGTRFYETDRYRVLSAILTRTTYPAAAIKEILEPLGLWEKVLADNILKKKLDELLKKEPLSPMVKRQLLATGEKKETSVVKLTRLGDNEEEEEEA